MVPETASCVTDEWPPQRLTKLSMLDAGVGVAEDVDAYECCLSDLKVSGEIRVD